MTVTRAHVAALKRVLRNFPLDDFPPGDYDRLEDLTAELDAHLDLMETVPDFPTDAEVADMARRAGLDGPPF